MEKAENRAFIRNRRNVAFLIFLVLDLFQVAFVSVLTFDEGAPIILGFDVALSNSYTSISVFAGISIAQMILLYLFALSVMNREGMTRIYPKYDEKEEWKCEYGRDEIVAWTKELAAQNDLAVNNIFVIRSPMPNAFTFSLPFIGSSVVLHSNTLDFLLPEEVKSIIAHELGHIRNKDSITKILSHIPGFFVGIIYLYIYIRLGLGAATSFIVDFNPLIGILRIVVLAGFVLLSRFMVAISKLFMQKASRDAELLADFYAADLTGPKQTMNALIRLGQRVETLTIFVEELRWLESLSEENRCKLTEEQLREMVFSYRLDQLDETNARKEAPRIYLNRKLKNFRNDYRLNLSDEQIEAAITPAVESLHKAREMKKELENLEEKTVDWRDVDYNQDERLDKEELMDLIRLLRTNSTKLMFTNEIGAELLMIDHPDFRRRILMLADLFPIQ